MSKTVLFLCHHGAAKSVLAAAYFAEAAKSRGLDLKVDYAGTEPDEETAPHVVALLTDEGIELEPKRPPLLTQEELSGADLVVSLGCPLDGYDVSGIEMEHWDEVPAPSEDLDGAARMIKDRVGSWSKKDVVSLLSELNLSLKQKRAAIAAALRSYSSP